MLQPTFRPFAASLLGSITPLSTVFLYTGVDFIVHQRSGPESFGFYAMWLMGFAGYVVSLLAGLGLCFIRAPRPFAGRFILAFGVVCLLLPALLAVEKLV